MQTFSSVSKFLKNTRSPTAALCFQIFVGARTQQPVIKIPPPLPRQIGGDLRAEKVFKRNVFTPMFSMPSSTWLQEEYFKAHNLAETLIHTFLFLLIDVITLLEAKDTKMNKTWAPPLRHSQSDEFVFTVQEWRWVPPMTGAGRGYWGITEEGQPKPDWEARASFLEVEVFGKDAGQVIVSSPLSSSGRHSWEGLVSSFTFWFLSPPHFQASIYNTRVCTRVYMCLHTHTHSTNALANKDWADHISQDSDLIGFCKRILHPWYLWLFTYNSCFSLLESFFSSQPSNEKHTGQGCPWPLEG